VMAGRDKKGEVNVRVHDKRRVPGSGAETDAKSSSGHHEPGSEGAAKRDYLDDLRRLQAEFDNYRKRMMKEQTAIAERATVRLIGHLLPVLDNFDRAAAHVGDDNSVALLHRQLKDVLIAEGLEEIPALGQPFDPQVHEAIESVEDESVTQATCKEVYRPGYRLKGQVIRPAMVVVARPPEPVADEDESRGQAGRDAVKG
jgi:molecular chaperone GrpE